MMNSFLQRALLLAIASTALPAHAQLADWRVVSSSNVLVPTAGFPSNVAPAFFATRWATSVAG